MIRVRCSHESAAPLRALVPPCNRKRRDSAPQSCCVRAQPEGGCLQARTGFLLGAKFAGTLVLDFLVSRTMRSECLLLKPSGLWNLTAAQAKLEGFCELSVILFTDLFLASVSQGPSAACHHPDQCACQWWDLHSY